MAKVLVYINFSLVLIAYYFDPKFLKVEYTV